MRILMLVTTASLCLLAACNGGAAHNSANAPAPAPAPAANTAAPAQAPAPAGAASGSANEIAECVAGADENLPAGTDANAFCTCAVGKIGTGTSQRDAINQCAAEMNITLPNPE